MIRRTFWIAVNSFIELERDKAVVGFLFVGAFFIIAGRVLSDISAVEQTNILLKFGLGTIFLIGVMTTLFSSTNILDREIREKQVFCTLSKPVPRWAWMAGKTAGFIAMQGVCVFLLTLFLYVFVWGVTGQSVKSLFVGGFFIFLLLLVIAGYTILFSTLTSQFMALFFGLLVLLIGYSVDDLKVYWHSASAAGRLASRALYYILPDLQSFSPYPVVIGNHHVPLRLVLFLTVYALAYLIIPLTIGMLVLERREFE